jgi:PAS domain S-box-containing protein
MNTGNRDYELLLENAPDATIMIDREGIIRYINLQAERLFLYNREELIGKPLEVLIPERYRAVHRSHRANYARAPRLRMMGVHIKHLAGLCKDGREFPAEISLSPLPEGYVLAGVRSRMNAFPEATANPPMSTLVLLVIIATVLMQMIAAALLYFVLR